MARFSFRKRSTEEDEDLGESLEGAEGSVMFDEEESGGRPRRLLIILGLVVIIAGGGYLAYTLFLAPSEMPPPPPRPLVLPPVAKAPESAPVPAPAPQVPPAPPVKPETKPESKPAPPPTPAPAKPAPAPAKRPAPPPKAEAKAPPKAEAKAAASSFSLQVGAMVMEGNAESLKARLESSGFPAIIRKGAAYITKHVVTAGEMGGKREAEELARRLSVDSFPSQLLASEGKFAPQVGAFFNLDEAIDLARELQKKSYHPKITSQPANTVVFQVRHGQFESRAAAVKRGEELRAKGFNPMVVRN